MKTTGRRSIVLYILLLCFLGGMAWFGVRLLNDGGKWVGQAYNGHIYDSGRAADPGRIYDRNGVLLAETLDGKRVYSENKKIRRSVLHTVGDSSGYIGTSVQATKRAELMGYNIFTGINKTPLAAFGGSGLKLTLDAEICAAAYEGLNGKNGSVIMYNYLTGETICKVSAPGYDPMNVPEDLLTNLDYDGVLLDNSLSSCYTPGSVFKIITAACAIENLDDWQTRTYFCEQEIKYKEGEVTCLDYHGELDLESAMKYSCNCYFALLAEDLGHKKLMRTAEELGFNDNFSFEGMNTSASLINLDRKTRDVDLGWAAVGQYTVTANTNHFMCLMGAIANGGSYVEPYAVDGFAFSPKETRLMSSATAGELKKLLRVTVSEYSGDDMFPGMSVCAKTGTAETGEGREPNAWMVGFSSDPEYPYAFAICVEEGGSGYRAAGSIATTIMTMAKERIG